MNAGDSYTVPYSISNFINNGYQGYVFDTNATLGRPSNSNYLGPYYVDINDSLGYYYGVGAIGNGSMYLVEGASVSGVNPAFTLHVEVLPYWGPAIYSIESFSDGNYVYSIIYENFTWIGGIRGNNTIYQLTQNFSLGQRYQGISTYHWLGLRPYLYPSPKVVVGTIQPASALRTSSSGRVLSVQSSRLPYGVSKP